MSIVIAGNWAAPTRSVVIVKKNRLKSRWTKIVAKRGKMNTKYFYFIKTYLYFYLPFLDWIGLTDGYWCRPGKGNSKLLIFVTLLMLLTICWLRLYDWWAFLKRQYTYNFRYYPLKTKPKNASPLSSPSGSFPSNRRLRPCQACCSSDTTRWQISTIYYLLAFFGYWRNWKWHFPHSLKPLITNIVPISGENVLRNHFWPLVSGFLTR